MRKIFLCAIATVAFSTAAFAADLPAQTYKKTPARTLTYDSWTGFYAGTEVGAKWGQGTWTTTSIVDAGNPVTQDASTTRDFNPLGARGGLFAGYNWQFAPQWVGGVELDWADTNKTTTAAGLPGCSIQCLGDPGPVADQSSVKLGWDASVRARLGYLVLPNLLAYGTGGVAWQRVASSATCQFSGPDPFCTSIVGTPFATATDSTTRIGWTIGAGVDAKIYENWILRAEYRYASFGTTNVLSTLSVPATVDVSTVAYQLKISTQIATLGLAYKFGP